jgi:hypothetical protein
MAFVILLIILFWIIPTEKGDKITKNLSTLFRVLPITKIAEAIIAWAKK